MRAVTEPFSPAAIDDELGQSARATGRHALDTCAVDRQAIDAALTSAADEADGIVSDREAAGDALEVAAEADVNGVAPLAAMSCVPPVWAQLLHLEELLTEWMTSNPACDGAAIADLRKREAPEFVAAPTVRQTTRVVAPAPPSSSDYVAKLAAKLMRRSA